jgi:YhhN-like protein
MFIGALWAAQAVLFAVGWCGPWRDAPARATNGRLPRPLRMALSLSLVLSAALIWAASPRRAVYAQWVLLGMSASFVGDLIMAELIRVPHRLIGGMAAFALAHALYVAAYVQTVHLSGAAVCNAGLWLGLAMFGGGGIVGWAAFIRNPNKDPLLNAGALLYGSWISVMASFALALAVALGGAWWLAAIGGVVFIVSDMLIGLTDIRGVRIHNGNDWIWLTYVAGQMGIIYAAWI